MTIRGKQRRTAARRPLWAAPLAFALGLGLAAPAWAASGSEALFNAIRANDLDAVKQIVEAGADPRGKDDKGVTAPQTAVRLGHYVIAHYLLAFRRPPSATPPAAPPATPDVAEASVPESAKPEPAKPEPSKSETKKPKAAKEIAKASPPPAPETPKGADAAKPTEPAAPAQEPIATLSESSVPTLPPPEPAPEATTAPAALAEAPPPTSAPELPKPAPAKEAGFFERATNWVSGLLGFGDKAAPQAAPQTRTAQAKPAAKPDAKAPATAAAKPDKPTAPGDAAETLADGDLPTPDLPKALADAPPPPGALDAALAVPDGDTKPDAAGGLDSLFAQPADKTAGKIGPRKTAATDSTAAPAKVDLKTMAPRDRLAWLDSLLARPLVRDAEATLKDSEDEALAHLRAQDKGRAGASDARAPALPPADAKTDTAAVDGPPPGTNLSRRLKIPLPPPDPNGRKSPARDPWFRDVSPDEPDVRAAHRQQRALPPERGTPPEKIPTVPQLTNLSKDKTLEQEVAINMPSAPPVAETQRPADEKKDAPIGVRHATAPPPQKSETAVKAAPESPAFALDQAGQDPLAAAFGNSPGNNAKPSGADPLAAELGLGDKPAGKTAAAKDPLAAEFGAPPGGAAASDPLAAELGAAPAKEAGKKDNGGKGPSAGDILSQALSGLADAIAGSGDAKAKAGAAAAEAPPPPATAAQVLAALPAGSEVKLGVDGRPALPAAWTLPVVLPGQAPPIQDLASAYVTPANFNPTPNKSDAQLGPLPTSGFATTAWPVTKIEMADGKKVTVPASREQKTAAKEPAAVAPTGEDQPLQGATLTLGLDTSLYNTFIPENAKGGEGRAADCVEKDRGRTQFCIKDLRWPAYLEQDFLVSTILYTGTASITRFDDGVPTRMLAQFHSEGFDAILDWLRRRFGPPTTTVTRSIAPFAQARRDNPTLTWRGVDKVTGNSILLEIRKYDDTRDGFPDVRNGIITLYREGAPGIFPEVSIHELMRLKRTG